MPIIKSAIKRMRQTTKRRARNVSLKRDIKTAVKNLIATPTAQTMSAAQSEIDTAVKKGLLKKNTGARRKAVLAKNAKAAGLSLNTTSKPAAKKPAAPKAVAKKPVADKKATVAKKPAAVKKPAAAKKPAVKKAPKTDK